MVKKKNFSLLLITALITTNVMSSNIYADTKLNSNYITTCPTQKIKLKLIGTNQKGKWASNNKKVATVINDGKIKIIKKGKATITVKCNKKSYNCKLVVWDSDKIYKRLEKLYNSFDSVNSQTIDIYSVESIYKNLKQIDNLTKKDAKFVNSLSGKKYKTFKAAYKKTISEFNTISQTLTAWREYYTSADYEQYSDKYNELTDLYDDNLYSLWSAKLEIYSALFDAQ